MLRNYQPSITILLLHFDALYRDHQIDIETIGVMLQEAIEAELERNQTTVWIYLCPPMHNPVRDWQELTETGLTLKSQFVDFDTVHVIDTSTFVNLPEDNVYGNDDSQRLTYAATFYALLGTNIVEKIVAEEQALEGASG